MNHTKPAHSASSAVRPLLEDYAPLPGTYDEPFEASDFDLFGHQLVTHLHERGHEGGTGASVTNPVDAHDVPVPYFGVVLSSDQFEAFAQQLRDAQVTFVIEPCIRFAGKVGEQATMFFRDPSGHALESKAFRNPSRLFAT
jgi:uncharacterized protein